MNTTTAKKINIVSFILAWIVFLVYFISTFSKDQETVLFGDIPIEIKSIIDVVIAVASLNFVYQFLYEEKKRKKLRLASTILNLFCIAYMAYTMMVR